MPDRTSMPFEAVRGHIIVPLAIGTGLVDTGSPTSFASAPFEFAGKRHAPPSSMMGVTPETISKLSGIRVDALIGCDILSGPEAMRIRWAERVIEFSDKFPEGGMTDRLHSLMGTPVFPVRLGMLETKAIFDTGAHLSYITPKLVATMMPVGHREDFHPLNGRFTAPVYHISTSIGDHSHELEYGTLPGALELMTAMAMHLSGSSAVIGTEILEHFDVAISWKRKFISWTHRSTADASTMLPPETRPLRQSAQHPTGIPDVRH